MSELESWLTKKAESASRINIQTRPSRKLKI